MDLNIKRSRDNVLIARIVIIATGEHGKSYFAAALAQMLGPKENMLVVGPVRLIAERIGGVKWFNVPTADREAQERFFSHVLELAKKPYEEGGHDPILIVDEADSYYSAGGRTYGSKSLQEIVNVGRNFGICQLYISRATSDLAATTLGNANLLFFGRVNSPPGLDWIRRYMRELPDAEKVITNLPPHVFLVWEPNGSPKLKGLAWLNVETGQIETKDLTQPPPEEPTEESPPDESERTSPSSESSASPPDATASSPTSASAPSAPSTIPPG